MGKKSIGGPDFSRAGIRNGGRHLPKRKIQSFHQDTRTIFQGIVFIKFKHLNQILLCRFLVNMPHKIEALQQNRLYKYKKIFLLTEMDLPCTNLKYMEPKRQNKKLQENISRRTSFETNQIIALWRKLGKTMTLFQWV